MTTKSGCLDNNIDLDLARVRGGGGLAGDFAQAQFRNNAEVVRRAVPVTKADELTMEDLFELNNDASFAFKGKDFICVASDSRMTSQKKHLFYGNTQEKIKSFNDNKMLMIANIYKGDSDYVDRFLKLKNEIFFFDNGEYMNVSHVNHTLSNLLFNRTNQLFMYVTVILCGFESGIDDFGQEKMVPKIFNVSFGGSPNEENIIAIGSAAPFITSCLDSFVGNSITYSANREKLDEDQAIEVASNILKSVSSKEISTGGVGHIKILRPEGVTKEIEISLKKD